MGVSFFLVLGRVFCLVFSVVSPRFCVSWCGNPLIAGFCRLGFLRIPGRVSGVQSCFGCGFLVPHRSAKSGCFGEYLNVFVVFLLENMGINLVL